MALVLQEDLYWTDLCPAGICEELNRRGTSTSSPTVGRLLEEYGFAKRQIEKTLAGGSVPDRNHGHLNLGLSCDTTRTGLSTTVHVMKKVYETGRKATDEFRENLPLKFDSVLPKWNYTAIPQPGH